MTRAQQTALIKLSRSIQDHCTSVDLALVKGDFERAKHWAEQAQNAAGLLVDALREADR